MKKFVILLFVLLPLLNSCSSDDAGVSEPQLTTNGTILKRVVLTNGSDIVTTDYFYNGNRIERIVGSNGIRLEYTYTGELITKLESYLNSVLKSTENYDYNLNGKITQIIGLEYANNYGIRHQFIYNIDGTINLTLFSGNLITQNTQSASKKVFLFPNEDVEKIEDYVIVNGNNVTKTNFFETNGLQLETSSFTEEMDTTGFIQFQIENTSCPARGSDWSGRHAGASGDFHRKQNRRHQRWRLRRRLLTARSHCCRQQSARQRCHHCCGRRYGRYRFRQRFA